MVAVVTLVGTSVPLAGAAPWSSTFLALSALGQAKGVKAEDPRQTAATLLSRARQAMDEGKLEIADSLVSQAESLNLRYGFTHLGDTPKKARRDLDKIRQGKKSAKPSDKFAPSAASAEKEQIPADPFSAQDAVGAASENPPVVNSLTDPKVIATRQLAKARTELARKNLVAAEHYYRESAAAGVSFELGEDSPAKLWADLQVAGSRVPPVHEGPAATASPAPTPGVVHPAQAAAPFGRGQSAAPPDSDDLDPALRAIRAPRRQPAAATTAAAGQPQSLLLEARRALSVGDLRRSVDLAAQAEAMHADFSPLDDSPAKVRQAVEQHQALAEMNRQGGSADDYRRRYSLFMVQQAEGLLGHGDFASAERLAKSAQTAGGDPVANQGAADVLEQIATMRSSGADRVAIERSQPGGVQQAGFDSAADATRNVPVQALDEADPTDPAAADSGFAFEENEPDTTSDEPIAPSADAATGDEPTAAAAPGDDFTGADLYSLGEAALRNGRGNQALEYFRQANQYRDQLEPADQAKLDAHLNRLGGTEKGPTEAIPPGRLPQPAAGAAQVAASALQADVANRLAAARAMVERDPELALKMFQETREHVEKQELESQVKEILLRRVERSAAEAGRFVDDNKSRIDLDAKNTAVRGDNERSRKHKIEVDGRIASLVDEHNKLMDQERYAEAELVVRRLRELDSEHPIVKQLTVHSKMVRRLRNDVAVRDLKEQGFVDAMGSVDRASIPFDDSQPVSFDGKRWNDIVSKRKPLAPGEAPPRSPRELEIMQKLRSNVSLEFESEPLAKVIDYLGKLTDINIVLDQTGLAEEGVTTDTPVTIKLNHEIQLRSALKLILEELHLNYVIEDEVLKITSEQSRRGKLWKKTYYVADLVIPIPNFVPTSKVGLAGAIQDAHGNLNMGQSGGAPQTVLASATGAQSNAVIDPSVMANLSSLSGMPGGNANSGQPMGQGPGGLGGGSMADFESLIELVQTTVQPDTWEELGGNGTISEYQTNLSLVINQTQEVHEEIVELLEQLRRLQDLQVTIEVRFITLNDNFFERMGVDFDFDIDDDTEKPFQVFGKQIGESTGGQPPVFDTQDRDHGKGVTVGLGQTGTFTQDLDIPFRQGSFGLAVPQFGGFDPAAGAQLGFAILSDIEAFFVINAAQGDRRSNVLQAPKVTLFNGQTASVADVSQSPFVVSVVPVVGDFAAAQQPVIVVLNEGTFLSVQAVVTSDRRFVRLTIVPFFSNIGEVNTFTFEGTSSTVEDTSQQGPQDNTTGRTNRRETTSSGTTVQLPTFSFVTVVTTVSVPDGGTVLLGGIKRLSEGRNEFGVPMLNKIPYVNRLFKNVGIGRETQSLMMMVTPRIIIQEEEEELILGTSQTP